MQVFNHFYPSIAGDLTDPHGTHRVCLKAILAAMDQLKDEVISILYIIGMVEEMYCLFVPRSVVGVGIRESTNGCSIVT